MMRARRGEGGEEEEGCFGRIEPCRLVYEGSRLDIGSVLEDVSGTGDRDGGRCDGR